MGVTVEGKVAAAPENPLVPNKVLRELYRKMVETRLIGEYESKVGRRPSPSHRHEACWVSLTHGLGAGDLVLNAQAGGVMKYLLGMRLGQALIRTEKKSKAGPGKTKTISTRVLPFVKEATARLFTGLGAALLLKRTGRTDLTVIFVRHGEVTPGEWKRVLTMAAALELPVILMVLPDRDSKSGTSRSKDTRGVSQIAHDCGMPGIRVDANDAVALYRVAQESIGRVRTGGGPVLIEGVPFRVPGKREPAAADPVMQMSQSLLRRKVSGTWWTSGVEKNFRKRLAAIRQA